MASNSERRQPGAIDDRNASLLSAIAGMGAPAGLISTLLEMGGHEMSLDDARFLNGPIIYHSGPSEWGKTIPRWMFDQVRAERTEIATGQLRMPVGPTEIAVVMYPATMEAPLHYLASQLYLWAAANAAARHYGKSMDQIWEETGSKPIPNEEVLKPGGLLYQGYCDLAREIRHKVITAQTNRERGEKRQAQEAAKEDLAPRIRKEEPIRPRKIAERPLPLPEQDMPIRAVEPRPPQPRKKPQQRPTEPSPQPGLFSWLLRGITGQ